MMDSVFKTQNMEGGASIAVSFRGTCLGTQVGADARNSVCRCFRGIAGGAE